jgi:hypothetical protein
MGTSDTVCDDSPHVHYRGAGKLPLPNECRPSAHAVQHQLCDYCGHTNWRTDDDGLQRQRNLVPLRSAVLTTKLSAVACATAGCRGLLQVST